MARPSPAGGVAKPARRRSPALGVKGIDNFTHLPVGVNFDPGGDQHADMVPVCMTPTARFAEYQFDCEMYPLY